MFSAIGLYWSFVALVVSLGSSNVNAAFTDNETDTMIMECLEAHGVSAEKLEEMMDNPSDGYYCIVDCFLKKTEIIDEHGMYNPEKALENFKPLVKDKETLSRVEEAAKDCSKVNEIKIQDRDDNCEKARLLTECLEEHKDIFD